MMRAGNIILRISRYCICNNKRPVTNDGILDSGGHVKCINNIRK